MSNPSTRSKLPRALAVAAGLVAALSGCDGGKLGADTGAGATDQPSPAVSDVAAEGDSLVSVSSTVAGTTVLAELEVLNVEAGVDNRDALVARVVHSGQQPVFNPAIIVQAGTENQIGSTAREGSTEVVDLDGDGVTETVVTGPTYICADLAPGSTTIEMLAYLADGSPPVRGLTSTLTVDEKDCAIVAHQPIDGEPGVGLGGWGF